MIGTLVRKNGNRMTNVQPGIHFLMLVLVDDTFSDFSNELDCIGILKRKGKFSRERERERERKERKRKKKE